MMYPKYPRRSYKSYSASEGKVALDFNKDNHSLLREILATVVTGNAAHGGKKGKLLGYLVAFIKYRNHNVENPNRAPSVLSVAEQLICFRAALVHDSWEVRAAALRCIRYLIRTREDAEACVACHIPIFVARSLDLMLENHSERIYALRLMRCMAFLAPDMFPDSMVRSLVAVIQDAPSMNDWMFKAALAVACELGLQNPVLLVECGGIAALSHSLSFCPSSAPAIAESVLGVLLYLLNALETRKLLALTPDDLTLAVEEHWTLKEILARTVETSLNHRDPLSVLHATMAPLTDTLFRSGDGGTEAVSVSDERDIQGQACIQVLLSALRSWSGMVSFFTRPNVEFMSGSLYSSQPPLKSIVSVLGAKNANTKVQVVNAIMVCLFELFQIPVPEWTDDFLQALRSTDPSAAQDSWKLYEGFVAAEGNALVPMPGVTRMRLAKNHAALLLSTFIAIGLLEALVNVVLESIPHLSTRAVILLGELLHLSDVLLPAGVCTTERQSCLKRLVAVGTDVNVLADERERALRSLSALARIHNLKKRPPRPFSPFLEQLMFFAREAGKKAVGSKKEAKKGTLLKNVNVAAPHHTGRRISVARKDREETLSAIVEETLVLKTDDFAQWNWNAISATFTSPHATFKRYWEEPLSRNMLTRLMTFFKPGSMQFSAMETGHRHARICTTVCCSLVTFLAEAEENDANRLLEDFASDIRVELGILAGEKAATNRVTAFTPSRVHNTMAHAYFLFVGRLTRNARGLRIVNKLGMIPLLYTLTAQPSHDSHQKLVLSSLDYSVGTPCRSILDKSLKQSTDTGRLYATQLLEVLARLETPDFHLWGTRMLAGQLYDSVSTISMAASRILDKVCDNERCLEALIDLKPGLLHFGERGLLLYIRFLSVPKGFYHLRDNGFLDSELEKWRDHGNLRYVKILESVLHDALSYYQRGEDGTYGRRTNDHHQVGQCRLVPHLYGELVRHKEAFDFLLEKEKTIVERYCEMIVSAAQETRKLDISHALQSETLGYDNAGDLLELKAAIWAIGHICTSDLGARHVIETYYEVVPSIAHMASSSPVFSIRGTCFYVLGLVAKTPPGVSFLAQIGWESVTVRSSDGWPTRNWEETSNEPVIEYSLELDEDLQLPALSGLGGLTTAMIRKKSDTGISNRGRSVSMEGAVGDSKSRADTGILLTDDVCEADEDQVASARHIGLPDSASSPIMLLERGSVNGADGVSLDQSGLSTDSGIVQEIEGGQDRRRAVAPLVYLTPPSESMDDRYGLTEDSLMYYPGRKPRVHRHTTCSADLPSNDLRMDIYLRQRSVTSESAPTELQDIDPAELSTFARRRPRFVPVPKSPGPSEQSSIFRSLRYYRRPELTAVPFEMPSEAPALTTPTSALIKGPHFLKDLFEQHQGEKRHSISVASYLSQSAPTKRRGKLWTHFSMRRNRRSESDALARLSTPPSKFNRSNSATDHNGDTRASGRTSLSTWLANKTPLFRRTRRQNSLGNASLSSQDSNEAHRTTNGPAFADIPEVPSQPDLLARGGVDEPDARKVAEALIEVDPPVDKHEEKVTKKKKEKIGPEVRYVGVALPRDFAVLLSAGMPTPNQSPVATTASTAAAAAGASVNGGLRDIPEADVLANVEDRQSDEFPGLQFLDTGDHRARPRAAGLAFHLSGSSIGSKSNDGGERFTADASRAVSERDLGETSGFRHDVARCIACHTALGLMAKYPEMPVHRSAFGTSDESNDGKPPKEVVVRREILRLVTSMCSSVGLRGAERELLLLKQKYPMVLRDPCVYSEVAKLMSQCTFRLQSRRFLQELFLDADFSYIWAVPQYILSENP